VDFPRAARAALVVAVIALLQIRFGIRYGGRSTPTSWKKAGTWAGALWIVAVIAFLLLGKN
jgi:hypothetical protein